MLGSIEDVNATQRLWQRHGVSYQDYGVPSPRLGAEVGDRSVWDSWIATQGGRMGPAYEKACPPPSIPPGRTLREVIAELMRRHHRATGFVELEQNNLDQLYACVARRIPVSLGLDWWGHQILVEALTGPGKARTCG